MTSIVEKCTTSKGYRRPRRPPATLRTKDGCLTCLQRKKKCDEHKETCSNCHRVGRKCNWRPATQEIATGSGILTEIHTSMPFVKNFSPDIMKSGLGPYGWLPVLPPEWPQQSWEIFRHYVNEYLPQLFRISADHIHSKAVEEQLVQRAFRNQYMMSTLLAQAALHLSVRNESYRVFALEYYAQAILGLRGYLGTNSVEFDAINVSLAALGLCIFESHMEQSHISENVIPHLNWVATVIRRRILVDSAYYDLSKSDADAVLHRLILESFLFHASRIPLLHENYILSTDFEAAISTAAQICESEAGRDALLWDRSPLLGLTPKVFILVYKLSCLFRTSLGDRKDSLPRSEVNFAAELLQKLKKSKSQNKDIGTKGFQLMILACQCLMSSLQGEPHSPNFKVTKVVVVQALRSVDLSTLPTTYLREFYRWPMLVLQNFIGGA